MTTNRVKSATTKRKVGKRPADAPPSWYERGGYWRKRLTVEGKQREFVYRYPNTKEGRQAATTAWAADYAAIARERQTEERRQQATSMLRALIDDDSLPAPVSPIDQFREMMDHPDPRIHGMVARMLKEITELVAPPNEHEQAQPRNGEVEATPLTELIDGYTRELERRNNLTKTRPEAVPKKQRMSDQSLQSTKARLGAFKAWLQAAGYDDINGDNLNVILKEYRSHLDARMDKGELSPATVTGRLVVVRPWVNWLHENHYIEHLPRNAKTIFRTYSSERNAKPIDKATIHKIWTLAKGDNRMRAFIALSLNCGLYEVELADLRVKDIQTKGGNAYLARKRCKTGQPYKIKLWEITKRLIDTTKDGKRDDDYLFLTSRGRPLVHYSGKSGSRAVSQALRNLLKDSTVTVSWSQFRDTTATEIERIGRRYGDTTLVSQVLAHADQRTAKWYVDAFAQGSSSPPSLLKPLPAPCSAPSSNDLTLLARSSDADCGWIPASNHGSPAPECPWTCSQPQATPPIAQPHRASPQQPSHRRAEQFELPRPLPRRTRRRPATRTGQARSTLRAGLPQSPRSNSDAVEHQQGARGSQ